MMKCRWIVLGLGLAGPLGCGTPKPEVNVRAYRQAVQVVEKPVAVVPDYAKGRGANFELIHPESPEVKAAMKEFEETGRAPSIRKNGFLYQPYTGYQTNLYCKTTRVCRIELAVGEVPVENAVFLGDTARWWWGLGVHGEGSEQAYSILFKPLWSDEEDGETCSYSTNMVVQTNLRTYQFGLICNEIHAYTRVMRFYYPEAIRKAWVRGADAAVKQEEAKVAEISLGPTIDIERLNMDHYQIRGDNVEWKPIRAFDDGKRVYLQMPESMESGEAPAVFVRSADGELALVNYRHIGRYLLIDRRFKEAVLIVGKGRRQKKVSVRYKPPKG